MCGIAISNTPGMVNKIMHRGVEAKEIYVGRQWVGHVRLPIQTEKGDSWAQPIKLWGKAQGRYLLYNGEIYNYPETYENDVAYLADLFSSMDLAGVMHEANNWDGMWAIAIVGPGVVTCFTDPLGKKQLYYNTKCEVCSEIKPLVDDRKAINPFYRSEVFKWGYNADELTPWSGVFRVMPNAVYTFYPGLFSEPEISYKNWFSWSPDTFSDGFPLRELDNTSLERAGELVRYYLELSTTRRMLSKDHKLGVLLSGGLDSSIVAYILAQNGADMVLYSLDNEEGIYAKKMAEKLGLSGRHVLIPGGHSRAWDEPEILGALHYNETPIDLGSLVPEHQMLGHVKEDIVITGDGADELFGGYRRNALYDSQLSDVFQELTFYHLPRLDRASMRYTIEMRTPFLGHDVVRLALRLPREHRTFKNVLKEAFRCYIPGEILDRPKLPLKSNSLKADPDKWRAYLHKLFYNVNQFSEQ